MQSRFHTALTLMSALMATGHAQVVRDLGSFGGPENMSADLSYDGSVVVGYSYDFHLHPYAFRWTAATGMQSVGNLGGTGQFSGAYANAVSADGDVVVGDSDIPSGPSHAFRWRAGVGMQDLGTLGGDNSSAKDVSADGEVVVGFSVDGAGALRAFRWTQQGGMVDLGTLGGSLAFANGVSADGNVVVGFARNAAGQDRAFRWTAAGGMTDLGTLGGSESSASAVNADGSVVVGSAEIAGGRSRAFRWTQATGLVQLPDLGGNHASAADVDDSGDIVVANGALPSGGSLRAYRWSAATGAVHLSGPSDEVSVSAVSGDGGAAAGVGFSFGGDFRALRWSWASIGAVFCAGELNSLGTPALLSAYGSLTVDRRDLALRAVGLPQGSWAFLMSSRDQASVFPFPGSQGRLCLGGALGLHRGAGEVQRTGADGALVWLTDPGALPTPTGPIAALPGETWRFQVWYRDAHPTPTSNLTEAVAVGY